MTEVVPLIDQEMVELPCAACGLRFSVPDVWQRQKAASGDDFWCPNGHGLHYLKDPPPSTHESGIGMPSLSPSLVFLLVIVLLGSAVYAFASSHSYAKGWDAASAYYAERDTGRLE